ncbi:hypothetical protein ACH4T9_14215 [Micromonospora sp. NPDC020750]
MGEPYFQPAVTDILAPVKFLLAPAVGGIPIRPAGPPRGDAFGVSR